MRLTDEALLDALDAERQKFTWSDDALMRSMVADLIARGVYPAQTVDGNPNDVWAMVMGYGARWFQWREPLACHHCAADLRDHRAGPPYKLELGHYDMIEDRTVDFMCPECKRSLREPKGAA